MKSRIFFKIGIISILLINTLDVFAQKSDFSGTWLMNNQASEFGQTSLSVMPNAINIKQTKDSIAIGGGATFESAKNPQSKRSYSINGVSIERLTADGGKIVGSCKLSTENNWLYRNQAIFVPENADTPKSKSREEWELSADRKSLTIHRNVEIDGKQLYSIKAVYSNQTTVKSN